LGNKNKITVTICIYSGKPNPHWQIGLKEYDKMLLLINSLPEAYPQLQKSLLGYSGIVVFAGTKNIYAFEEIITISDDKLKKGYVDKKRVVERKLLQSAPAAIQKEIKGMLPEELR